LDSHLSDTQIETSSNHTNSHLRQTRTSSKQSDSDYHTLSSPLNQQSYSASDHQNVQPSSYCSSVETSRRTRTKSGESTSTTVISTLFERYEKTLRERQRTVAIVNDELLDIDKVLKHYRDKLQKPVSTQSDKVFFLILILFFM
jgi:viroplasmin and RNaseH domain-containing protein